MPRLPQILYRSSVIGACCFIAVSGMADSRVVVVANANEIYTQRKYGDGGSKRETYVYMQGRYHPGGTVDRSIERMTFRDVLSYLSPKLALQSFVPAKTVEESDLVLVVHWGVTNPRVDAREMLAITALYTPPPDTSVHADPNDVDSAESTPEAPEPLNRNELTGSEDRFADLERANEVGRAESVNRDLAQLLGYAGPLIKLGRRMRVTPEEQTLRYDFSKERYFIVVRAYDLHARRDEKMTPVWTLHMNVSSPGNNFQTALARMSQVAPDFFGRTTDDVQTVRAKLVDVKVELGEPIILGESKE